MNNYPELIDIGGGVWSGAIPGMPGNHKLVPADAIVIERGDLPEVKAVGGSVRAGSLTFAADKDPAQVRNWALDYLAAAEHLAAHPPVDEARVEALAAEMADAGANPTSSVTANLELLSIARRLVEQGWTNPEVSK